jgi:hypothetical protein
MSSPPDNVKLEGLIADNWDEHAVTPGIVDLLEPYRADVESVAERFDESEASWRDYRSAVWSVVPQGVMELVQRIAIDIQAAQMAARWTPRSGEPDIDSIAGVDLLVSDRYELADLARAGIVVIRHEPADRGLIARVRFPPRCARHRFIPGVGAGIRVMVPGGEIVLEGDTSPWRARLARVPEGFLDLRHVPLATLAREVMNRGASVVFEEPLNPDGTIGGN